MQTKDDTGTTSRKLPNKHNHKKQKYAHHRYTINIGISTLTKAIIIVFRCPDVTKEYDSCVRAAVPAEGQCRRLVSPVLHPSPSSCPDVQDKQALSVKSEKGYWEQPPPKISPPKPSRLYYAIPDKSIISRGLASDTHLQQTGKQVNCNLFANTDLKTSGRTSTQEPSSLDTKHSVSQFFSHLTVEICENP